jgi:hypothetical protein
MTAAGDDVEHASDSNRYRDVQLIAMEVDPTLLLRMPEGDQQHVGARLGNAGKNVDVIHVLHGSPRRLKRSCDDKAWIELAKSNGSRLCDPVLAAEQENPSSTLGSLL